MLTFDETVDTSTINITYITLFSQETEVEEMENVTNVTSSGSGASGSGSVVVPTMFSYTLTGLKNITEIDGPVVTIMLIDDDLHEIKLLRGLASNPNNTFIQLLDSTFLDNALIPNPSQESFLPVSQQDYGFDIVAPRVTSFTFNVNTGLLTLYFSEPVDRSTFDPTGLTLQGAEVVMNIQQQTLTLTGGSSTSGDGLMIVLKLTEDDLNELKRKTQIFASIETTYITVNQSFIRDIAGNSIAPIIDGSALQAAAFYNDTTMPELVGFSLDMDSGTFNLTFSETVNVRSLKLTELTMQRTPAVSDGFYNYTLTGGDLFSMQNRTTVLINISDTDLNEIKARSIANNASTAYLVFPGSAILDMNNRMVVPHINGMSAFLATEYIPDETLPELTCFSVNLNSSVVELTFSETVNVLKTYTPSQLTLQNARMGVYDQDGLLYYSLTSSTASTASSYNSPIVTITLGYRDINAIKQRGQLVTSINNSYISLGSGFIQDTVGNPIKTIPLNNGLQACSFYNDFIRPELHNYSLNLSSETLELSFSETVNTATFDITQFTLYASGTGSGESYTLTGGTVSSPPSITVSILLSDLDLNIIKQRYGLATSSSNTFLSITEAALQDMAGQYVYPVNASAVTNYTEDSVAPELVSFNLDLNAGPGILYLTFSETVNRETLQVGSIALQDDTTASSQYTLVSSVSNTTNSTTVIIFLSEEDSNAVKTLTNVATSGTNTYITLLSTAIEDMNGNQVNAVPNKSARRVMSFTPDTTQPILRSFTLNLTSEYLRLTFSETVQATSFDPTEIIIQSSAASPVSSYRLTGGTIAPINTSVISLKLLFDDLNALKSRIDLATNNSNTFLSTSSNLVRDMNSNRLVAIPTNKALMGKVYRDSTQPAVRSITVDLDNGQLVLNFTYQLSHQY